MLEDASHETITDCGEDGELPPVNAMCESTKMTGTLAVLVAGVAVLADSVFVLAMLYPVLLVIRYGVIAREERYLEEKFGQEYLDYKAVVRRWF